MSNWVIMVAKGATPREYVAVVDAGMLVRKVNKETLPTWRLVEVPLVFKDLDPVDILNACIDGRIVI